MRSKMKGLVMVACLCLVSLSYAFADDSMEKCPMGMKGMQAMTKKQDKMDCEEKLDHKIHFILMRSEELGLNDEQIEQIQTLKYKTKKSVILKDAEIDSLGLDIMDAFRKDDVDINAVNKIIDKKYEVKKQKAKELINAYASLNTILTKEQQKKLKETPRMMDRMKKTMHRGSEMHPMRDPSMKKE